MDVLTQLGIGGIFAILILREVFNYLGKKSTSGPATACAIGDNTKAARQIERLYEWHDKEDQDGVKVWYVRSTLEKAIDKLTEAVERDAQVSERILERLDEMDDN